MYYRERTTPPSDWKRIRFSEFYRLGLSKLENIEFKEESSSPKQIQQRKNFIRKGQAASVAAQIYKLKIQHKAFLTPRELKILSEAISIFQMIAGLKSPSNA